MQLEKIPELRQQLIEAQENAVVAFREAETELKLLYTKGSQYVNNGIQTDTDSKEASTIVATINKKEKEIEEQRKSVTRILDSVKSDWIDRQTNLLSETTEIKKSLSQLNNKYLSDKAEKIRLQKEKIELEANQKIERELLPKRIDNCIETALYTELSNIKQAMTISWTKFTAENFEEKIIVMKAFKPKVTTDKLLSYIKIQSQYLKPEEVESVIRAKVESGYNKFCQEYSRLFEGIKKEFTDKIDQKREELKTQSEADRIRLEEEAQQKLINDKAQELLDQRIRESALLEQESNKVIAADLEMQAKLGGLDEVKGRTVWSAYITGTPDWGKIVNMYIEAEGVEKLEFLLTWLCKNGRPKIDGITYESSKKVVNRL